MAVITASPKNFAAMLDMQATANEHLFTMRKLLETSQLTQIASLVEQKRIDDDGDRLEKIEKDTLETDKKALEIQKEQLKLMQEDAEERKKRQEAIEKIMENMKVLRSPLEKMKESFAGFRAKFSPESLKTAFLQSTNVLGMNNKRLEKDRFMKEQKALGFEGSDKDLAKKFELAFSTRKEAAGVDKQIEKIRSQAGGKYSAEEIAKTNKEMADLLKKKSAITEEYGQYDIGAKIRTEKETPSLIQPLPQQEVTKPVAPAPMTALTPAPVIQQTPTDAFASAGEAQEMAQEQAKAVGEQTSLLQKIEENTRGGTAPAAKGEEGGGGILAGIGAGLKGLGMGLKGLGTGAGKGIQALLMGLAKGVMALANPMALVGLGALTLAAMGLGKALQLAAPAIEAFAPVLMKVVEVIGDVFVKAIETIPEVIKSVGDVIIGVVTAISDAITGIIDAVVTSIERLAAIDGSNLLSVGAGLVAIAGGMAAFGAGSAVAGVGNLVGGLLGAITPGGSPVDQIMKLGKEGPNIEKAGIGVEKLAAGLTAFSGINTEKIKAIAALPTEKIAAMGAAMGNAGTVESKSAQNRALDAQAGAGGGNTAVVAPTVNNVTRKTELIKPPIRNQESSVNRWLATKYH